MKFLQKCLLYIVLISLNLGLYLIAPNVGYVRVVFLDHKINLDFYIIVCIVFTVIYLVSILMQLIKTIKNFFKKSEKKHERESIQNLARFIVSNDSQAEKNIDDKFCLCKTAVLINNGAIVSYNTGVNEVDILNVKNKIQFSLQTKHLDKAIELVNYAIKNFPQQLSAIQDELLQISITAILENKTFEFNPARSKYNLNSEFVSEYNIQKGLAIAEITTDTLIKLKILENLYKKYNTNTEIAKRLLLAIANDGHDKKKALKLIEKIFEISPDRNLVFIFTKLCTTNDAFDIADDLLKCVSDNNVEKLWFLLAVATQLRLYSKIIELIKLLIENKTNENELYVFFVKNYDILSVDDEIVKLICK